MLSDKCFACHGPDAKTVEGDLRLDLADEARKPGGAIVPGDADTSELVRRIFSDDPDEQMPPPEAHKPLEPAERDLLRRWIAEGAEYEPHWAYTALRVASSSRVAANGGRIDRYIDERLAEEGIQPQPSADRVTLIRRLSFDLTGIPPTLEEVDAFLQDTSDKAYERVVDRLLNSGRYGERMAIYWLDLVRYADTVGYHGDQNVSQSPYRDYVISAFNDNMPYDQFVREQLAGDLLPNATIEQQVASGYNRLNQTTEEGGSQAKEYLAIYFADRVRNVSQVFMGATIGCAQCHDHKFDPYTTRDFYSLGAFFADLDERGVYGARARPPMLRLPSAEQREQLAEIEDRSKRLKAQVAPLRDRLLASQAQWESEAGAPTNQQDIPAPVAEALRVEREQRSAEQVKVVQDYYVANAEPMIALEKQIAEAESERKKVEQTVLMTVVSRAVKPRTIRVLPRGNWMDDSGEIVAPAIPAFLGELDTGDRRANRLDLAHWLCNPSNPLTSRTMVNRLWSLLFGRGICTSVDDFGGQGTFPSHPDLLDWLALEFVESGWDIKHVMRLIVNSDAYRRSSKPTAELRERDPYNELFARQGRFRVDAEMVRDSALATSGLLIEKIGGESIRPYQPAGYYAQLNFPRRKYVADQGDNQYRRGVYTHWQRTFLHPMLKAFDAPSREECTARRSRSNTPLQALTLLNDPTFVETARVFAARIMNEGGATTDQRIAWAYRVAVSRQPDPAVGKELRRVFDRHLEHYRSNDSNAKQLVAAGSAPVATDLDTAELAAWTSVARVILNLHETITRY